MWNDTLCNSRKMDPKPEITLRKGNVVILHTRTQSSTLQDSDHGIGLSVQAGTFRWVRSMKSLSLWNQIVDLIVLFYSIWFRALENFISIFWFWFFFDVVLDETRFHTNGNGLVLRKRNCCKRLKDVLNMYLPWDCPAFEDFLGHPGFVFDPLPSQWEVLVTLPQNATRVSVAQIHPVHPDDT